MTQRRKDKKGSNLNCRPELLSIHFSACCLLLHCFCFQAQTISPKQISDTLCCSHCRSYTNAATLNEWIELTGVHVGRALPELMACSSAHRLRRGRREGSLFGIIIPPSLWSTLLPFLSVTVSSLIHLFIPCLSPQSNCSASSCLAVIMSVSNCLIPARRCTWEREADTTWSKPSVREYLYETEGESLLLREGPSSLRQTATGMYQRGMNSRLRTRRGEWKSLPCLRDLRCTQWGAGDLKKHKITLDTITFFDSEESPLWNP